MSKRFFTTMGLMVAMVAVAAPVFAQDGQTAAAGGGMGWQVWSIITAGFALGIAAFGGALGQGRATAAAAEGLARNPSAAGEIRGAMILGLVLIESLVIYVLLISLILFFLKPFAPAP
ncbi:MAG TPA: ATP synthase F0 subunit C [Vicinamibacterales bacterium]|nr:ATP synthase F0 subunit C [Vicinamibacterales bacterium]